MAGNPLADNYSTMYERAMEPLARYAEDVDIDVEGDAQPQVNPFTGAINIPQENGDVVIQFPGSFKEQDEDADDHDANLADSLDEYNLNAIAEDTIQGIEEDISNREGWLSATEKGIELLAMKVEGARSGVGDTTAPVEGMSNVRSSLLQEAVLRFQANARGELLPADGPVKIKNSGRASILNDEQAERLERDFNTYLTKTAREYYPDTDRLLFSVGFRGCGFKKVYHDPIKRRPVSESIDAKDLIVPTSAIDLSSAVRATHKTTMSSAVMKRMQLAGVYRDIELTHPTPKVDPVTAKMANSQGMAAVTQRMEDQEYTLYECYRTLDLPGFEDVGEDGEPTGLQLPYRLTIDRDSRKILEIRRNWKSGDETKCAKRVFVKYSFVPAFGFYDLGLLNILGNASQALTLAWRMSLDSGSFANFPGFIYSEAAVGRQKVNDIKIPPGGGMGLDIGQQDIRAAIMPLPYKEPGSTFVALMNELQQIMQRVGGTAETNVAEGRADAPVGTTIALIEQATKIMDAVHKRLHQAQAEEFQLLRELFREDPEALHRHNDSPEFPQNVTLLQQALDNYELIPVADPNVPSSMHRHMRVAALAQVATNPAWMGRFDQDKVLNVILRDMKWSPDELLIPPGQQQQAPNPAIIAAMQKSQAQQQKNASDEANRQIDLLRMQHDATESEKDRKSKEDLAILQLANTQVIHPYSAGLASNPALPRQIQRTPQ